MPLNYPKVSFVIPCYKLAHLLPQCIDSILSQTYSDFEILIMNDRSPDDTARVAKRYQDKRVKHIENESNLGHLRNYNKGIEMSRGQYIWLISADDYLRVPYILERYVRLMDSSSTVGYVVCPGFSVRNSKEKELIGTCQLNEGVIRGHQFLKELLDHNFVLAASAMVRRECYEQLGMFPLRASWNSAPIDMGWLGDWYLWCIFALHFDVGYLSEPMVCYREHDLSMTTGLIRDEKVAGCASSDLGMLWLMRDLARKACFSEVAWDCLVSIANEYAHQATSKRYRFATYRLSMRALNESLSKATDSQQEREWIRARVFDRLADKMIFRQKLHSARLLYIASINCDKKWLKVYLKVLLVSLGNPGRWLRVIIRKIRVLSGSLTNSAVPARDTQTMETNEA
jgi:glycosyltransferase involved in cell wall biosynthesis